MDSSHKQYIHSLSPGLKISPDANETLINTMLKKHIAMMTIHSRINFNYFVIETRTRVPYVCDFINQNVLRLNSRPEASTILFWCWYQQGSIYLFISRFCHCTYVQWQNLLVYYYLLVYYLPASQYLPCY